MKGLLSTMTILSLCSLPLMAKGQWKQVRTDACSGKSAGDSCSFEGKRGTVQGQCVQGKRDPSKLVCKDPNRKKRGSFNLLDKLNLSNEQIEKLAQFKNNHRSKKDEMRGNKREFREQMKELFLENRPDSELTALHYKISKHRQLKGELKLQKMIFLKNLLTPQQRKSYIEMRGQQRGARHGRR